MMANFQPPVDPAQTADTVRGWWRRRQARKAAEAAEVARVFDAWAASPEGRAYIAEYGYEDWESLH